MTRPAVFGPTDEVVYAVALEAWSLLDTWMSEDPTHKALKDDPPARVRAICATYGEHLKPAWLAMRARLGQPVADKEPVE